MRRILAASVLGFIGLTVAIVPARAAGTTSHQNTTNWGQRDTAVYVVSTLNLLHMRSGKPLTDFLARKLDVARYAVYADTVVSDLYFIQLRREDASVAGVFAYQIGWVKPMLVSLGLPRTVAHRVTDKIAQEYRTDSKQLIGSFNSTLPS